MSKGFLARTMTVSYENLNIGMLILVHRISCIMGYIHVKCHHYY